MKWINSFDLRLITDELLATSSNKDIDIESFKKIAELTVSDPSLFCVYGLEDTGAIKRAVVCHYCPMDHHIHVDFWFGGRGTDDRLMESFKGFKKVFPRARGIKNIKTDKLGDL